MRKNLSQKTSAARKRRQARPELKLRRILVPLDFSGLSRQALDFAVPLAKQYGGKIILMHVVQPTAVPTLDVVPGGGHYLALDMQIFIDTARKRLMAMAIERLPAALRGQAVVREGNPYHEITSAARKLKADLIVLSTHGRTGLERILIGSTAERVVRHAHCPVLAVRRQSGAPATRMLTQEKPVYAKRLPWHRILVPLDFSQTSLSALRVAVPLAKQSGARLLLLNVVEPNPYATGMEGAVLVVPDSAIARNAKQQLPQVARRFIPKSVRVASLVARGRAADVIVQTAEDKGVDLIVLSTHGHTGLDRLLMGNTAEQIVRHAKCPVFVVRKSQGQRHGGN
jgi:nucleotide-binding universal stress UspA family protein